MKNSASPTEKNIQRFWDNTIDLLRKKGIKTGEERWFVYQTEQYIKAYADLRLTQHTPGNVTQYLNKLGQRSKLADSQYRQAALAIQNLFVLTKSHWLDEVDWSHWLESSTLLTANHPIRARKNFEPGRNSVSDSLQVTTIRFFSFISRYWKITSISCSWRMTRTISSCWRRSKSEDRCRTFICTKKQLKVILLSFTHSIHIQTHNNVCRLQFWYSFPLTIQSTALLLNLAPL